MTKRKPISVLLTDTHKAKDNLKLVKSIFSQAADLALELGLKRVYHAGDFFTDRVGQNLATLLAFQYILDEYYERGLILVGIPGNHDKTDQDSPKSYLNIFQNHKAFQLVDEEAFDTVGDTLIGFLPFFTKSYKERLKKLEKDAKALKNKHNVLITHQAFNGVMNNDGTLVEDSVSPKDVKFWDSVLVGHYHDASDVGKNIKYIGSAYQTNFGENSEDKGFQILYSDGTIEFEPSDFPKYIKVKVNLEKDFENEIELYSDEAYKDDNIRFIFEGDREMQHKVDREKLEEIGIDFKFELSDINTEVLKASEGDFSSINSINIPSLFMEYAKIQSFKSKKIVKGLKILKA